MNNKGSFEFYSLWKEKFNAIGIIPSSGKNSKGTFAHSDIAFEFAQNNYFC